MDIRDEQPRERPKMIASSYVIRGQCPECHETFIVTEGVHPCPFCGLILDCYL